VNDLEGHNNNFIMNELDLRRGAKSKFLACYKDDPTTLVLDELGLRHGAARIDIALVNGMIHGYELKSDKDNLRRLPHQIEIYNSVLDRITLVTTDRHADYAGRMIPEWWGIKIAIRNSAHVIEFSDLREASDNPALDILGVSKLLWREEALTLLDEFGEAGPLRYKRRALIYARLAEIADLDTVRERVRRQLKLRQTWKVGL
jgi:hypothetical protein